MSKYERFLIYPLLILALVYGLVGNPLLQVSNSREVFNVIEAREIIIVNEEGVRVANICLLYTSPSPRDRS